MSAIRRAKKTRRRKFEPRSQDSGLRPAPRALAQPGEKESLARPVARGRLPVCEAGFLASSICRCLCVLVLNSFFVSAVLARTKAKSAGPVTVPELELAGGRRLVYQGSIFSEKQVRGGHRFWSRLLDVAIGEPTVHELIEPYSVVTDSRGRIIVTDLGSSGVDIFDFARHKYKFISRHKETDGLVYPQCVAVDSRDNIYVTDSSSGMIFVFDANGKFRRVIGALKGGEGYFKRPTGIAVDSEAQRIYVTDTLRHRIYVLDMEGHILQQIGRRGTGNGEFNYPTTLRLEGHELFVVDAMNFRVQVLDLSGKFLYAIGGLGNGAEELFRPKGVGVDSEGHLYVVEGLSDMVEVFDRQGRLLYYFGQPGTGLGNFQLPTGLFIDGKDRVYVVDSYNRRVEVFQYFGVKSK
jgi:sugar lactone lactonase YvrE